MPQTIELRKKAPQSKRKKNATYVFPVEDIRSSRRTTLFDVSGKSRIRIIDGSLETQDKALKNLLEKLSKMNRDMEEAEKRSKCQIRVSVIKP